MSYQPSNEEIKHRRNVFLEKTDIYVLPDRWDNYTLEEKNAWSLYRQTLRDIPSQPGFPTLINWPTSPIAFNIEKPVGWPEEWP